MNSPWTRTAALVAVAALSMALATAPPAHAASDPIIAAAQGFSAPANPLAERVVLSKGTMVATTPHSRTTWGQGLDEGIEVARTRSTLTLRGRGLPRCAPARWNTSLDAYSYDCGGVSLTPLPKQDGGVQLVSIITAPTQNSVSFAFDSPDGTPTAHTASGGAVLTVGEDTVVGSVARPEAVDADGKPVRTWFETSGGVLTQRLDLTGHRLPVVASTYFGAITPPPLTSLPSWLGALLTQHANADAIRSVRWITRGSVASLSIEAAWWFRPAIAHQRVHLISAWLVALEKTPTTSLQGCAYSPTTAGTMEMWWQYRCHVGFALWKTPWNLEPSSVRNSYWEYVREGCQ